MIAKQLTKTDGMYILVILMALIHNPHPKGFDLFIIVSSALFLLF